MVPNVCSSAGVSPASQMRTKAPLSLPVPPFIANSGNAKAASRVFASAARQTRTSRKQQEPVKESTPEQSNLFATGATQVANLMNTLLFGAASRLERGTSVCVACRGTGTVTCKDCQATGVLKPSASKALGGSLQKIMGTKSKEKEWIVSNRCRKCRGHGRLECPGCDGLGKRFVDSQAGWD